MQSVKEAKGNPFSEELMIADLATQEAAKATADYLTANPENWYPCGFAWVKIRPATGRFVKALKERGDGQTSDMGGFVIYNPSGNHTQAMYAKLAGAEVYARTLNEWFQQCGLKNKAYVESRID